MITCTSTFNSSCRRIDIVLTKNGICTLVDIIIVNPTRAYLLPQSYAIQGFATSNAAKAKERSYCNRHPINQFLSLAIEVFGYLHKYADVFLHDCANATWSLKGTKCPHLSTLVTFFHQKVSITLQRMQASFILNQVVVVGLVLSQLPPCQDTPPITMADLLQVVDL